MTKNIVALMLLTVVLSLILCACGDKDSLPVEKQGFAMGTVIIQNINHKDYDNISSEVIDRINEIESLMTINKRGGEINLLNEGSGNEAVKIGKDTLNVLNAARTYSQLSGGSFDITVGPLVKAWGVFTDTPSVPSTEEIQRLIKLVNYNDLIIDNSNSSAKLNVEGQMVDVGGIAKGYAADQAIDVYKKKGVESAFISIGGNIATLGGKTDGSPWRIGIRNPRGPEGSYIGIVSLKNKSVVSSGDYERNFELNGVKYHHIMDPNTGYPANSGLIGTTIVSDSSIDADALSTAVFVLGLEKGIKLIESLDEVDAIFVTEDKRVYITKGLQNCFEFKDESKEFEYVEKR